VSDAPTPDPEQIIRQLREDLRRAEADRRRLDEERVRLERERAQLELSHLDRRAHALHADHPRALLPGQVQEVLHDALDIRDRAVAGTISQQGAAIARGHLINRLSTLLDHTATVAAIRRFVAHLNREWTACSAFSLTWTSRPPTSGRNMPFGGRW
jgi:hypothetical protein